MGLNSKSSRSSHKWVAEQDGAFLSQTVCQMLTDQLCQKVGRRHLLDQLYPDDNDERAFSKVTSSRIDSLVSSLNNLSTNQEALKTQVEAISKQLEKITTSNARNTSTCGQCTSRGNFRGRNFGGGRYQSAGPFQNCGNFDNVNSIPFRLTTQHNATGATHTTARFTSSVTNNHSETRAATSNDMVATSRNNCYLISHTLPHR